VTSTIWSHENVGSNGATPGKAFAAGFDREADDFEFAVNDVVAR
jgi:hypothetical protein